MDSTRPVPICTPSENARSMQTFLWKDHGRVYLYPNPESLALGATEHLVRILRAGLAQAPRFHWVLAGGKTPAACYRQMAIMIQLGCTGPDRTPRSKSWGGVLNRM